MTYSSEEICNAYKLFLGREIEDGIDLESFKQIDTEDLIAYFVYSDEFLINTINPLFNRQNLTNIAEYASDIDRSTAFNLCSSINIDSNTEILESTTRSALILRLIEESCKKKSYNKNNNYSEVKRYVRIAGPLIRLVEVISRVFYQYNLETSSTTIADIEQLYQTLLGRSPESEAAISSKTDRHISKNIESIVTSYEFNLKVMNQVTDGKTCFIDGRTAIIAGSFLEKAAYLKQELKFSGRKLVSAIIISAANLDRNLDFDLILNRLAEEPTLESFVYLGDNLNYRSPYNSSIIAKYKREIENQKLFDPEYYVSENPCVSINIQDALEHYLIYGYQLYYSPSKNINESAAQSNNTHSPGLLNLISYDYSRFDRESSNYPIHEVRNGISFCSRFGLNEYSEYSRESIEEAVSYLASKCTQYSIEGNTKASIIIPAYGQMGYVLSCLDSLSTQKFDFSVEVILFDDQSPLETGIHLTEQIPWIKYVKAQQNLGFLEACNSAVLLSQGEIIILLNSDTRVCKSWLNEIVRPLVDEKSTGLVGSKLYNEDGSLQEAGGVIWRDATGWNYGRDTKLPEASQYSYKRTVDYCSGAAIALRKSDWDDVGGFDAQFKPAYYEDVDLAFALTEKGLDVVLNPLARVIHYEGKTHGRDETVGVKAYIGSNRLKFLGKWQNRLIKHDLPGQRPAQNADRNIRRNVLVLDAETPKPDRDAGSVVCYTIINQLISLNYKVIFIPTHEKLRSAEYSDNLTRMGVEVFQDFNGDLLSIISRLNETPIELVVGFRWNVLYELIPQIRGHLPCARIIYHTIDLHYLRLERESILTKSWLTRSAAEDAHDNEIHTALMSDCTILTSSAEEEILIKELPDIPIVVYPYVIKCQKNKSTFEDRNNILFFGGFRHLPNVDAALFLANEIWPSLPASVQQRMELVIAGPDAPQSIKELSSANIKVLGHVKDLDTVIDKSLIMVAPLRYGAGIKGKVLTSMASGLPVISTDIAIEGTGMRHGEELLVANTVSSFVSEITRVISDRVLWKHLQSTAYDFIECNYSEEQGLIKLQKSIDLADSNWIARRKIQRLRLIDNFQN